MRHHGLRARNARCYRDHIGPRWSGRHDQLAPARRRHVDRGRLGDLRRRCVTGLTSARGRFRRGRAGHGVSFWLDLCRGRFRRSRGGHGVSFRLGFCHGRFRRCRTGNGASFWLDLCLRLGRGDDRPGHTPPGRRGPRVWSRCPTAGNRRLDRCLLQRLRDRGDRRLRGCDMRWNEHNAQLGHLDASFLPGEAQTRKPKSLPTEGQAQQRSVNQQREQQRRSHSPSLKAHALDPRLPERCGLRRLLSRRIGWRCQRGVGTLARSSTLPTPLRP